MLSLKFLGRGSAFNPSMGNTSAYVTIDKRLYLIDCGETVFERLLRTVDLEKYEIWVLLTHLHADHVGSLGSLISYHFIVNHQRVRVFHVQSNVVDLLALQGIEPHFYEFVCATKLVHEDFSVKAIEVSHVPNMMCYGFLINHNGKTIFYSGDANTIPSEILSALHAGEIDRLYQDTSSHRTEHPTHCDMWRLAEMIEKPQRSKVYAMHLDNDYTKELRELGFQVVETII